MARIMNDIALLDDDVVASGGDWQVVESTMEHQRQLVLNNKGDYKENPTICVGAEMYLDDDSGFERLIREITVEYGKDGMAVQSVGLNAAGEIISKADYK
jgi:hypothetical protein